jgi:hypothetical protein
MDAPEIEVKNPDDPKERLIGLVTAIIAILLAINSSLGHKAGSDEIISNVKASNTWAQFQAKRGRETMYEVGIEIVKSLNVKDTSATAKAMQKYAETITRYEEEVKEISKEAKEKEAEAETAQKKGDRHDIADIFFQVAIIFCSVTILTKQELFYKLGMGVAALGIGLMIYALLT